MKLVFISYSSKDRDFADRLRADLQTNGVDVWIDRTGLKAGTRDWEQALRDAIRNAQAVVLVASPNSRQSNPVKGELAIAEMYACPVFPVWASGEMWPESIALDRITMQYIDARGDAYGDAVLELVEALGLMPISTEHSQSVPKLDFEPRNPYKGLRAFRESDADDFFGRDTLVDELVSMFAERLDSDRRLLAVVGPSGSGKSSVVMAGLLPRLRAGALPGSAEWVYLDPIVPGGRPLESLTITLSNALHRANTIIRQDLDDPDGRGLHILGRQVVGQADRKLQLLIDQFEELFTQTINDNERRQFIALLVAAVSEPKGPVTVILTLRADFYDRPMEYPALFDLLQPHLPVPPMSIDNLRDVIEKPAALPDVQVTFEKGLVGDLLFEVRERVGGLPLLQFTLDQLFEQRDNHTLTLAAYREIGGLRGALVRHAEATYAELDTNDHRQLARTLFLRLIQPGATEQDTTRRRADMSELELPDTGQTQILREVADTFVTARLLTTGEVAGKATIEVSHEALIREWERLGGWLTEARDDIVIQQDVSNDAAAWIDEGRKPDDDLLYRGTVLEAQLTWAARNIPSKDEQAFLEASQQQELGLAEKERRRQRLLFLSGLAVIMVIFASLVAVLIILSRDNEGLQNEVNAFQVEVHAFEIRQERMETLAAGGVGFVPFGKDQPPQVIFASATQIAALNNLDSHNPVIDEAYKAQYGVEMVQVPVGCFWMGSVLGDSDEYPVHEVCFDEPFWIDRYEVTYEQFDRLKGEAVATPSWTNLNQPRTSVTWLEAWDFCVKRDAYMPTERQWEYAARGPDSPEYPWGNDLPEVYSYLNSPDFANSYVEEPVDVGSSSQDISWVGAHDMSGNVSEWASSLYSGEFVIMYPEHFDLEYDNLHIRGLRAVRGGSYKSEIDGLRAAARGTAPPEDTTEAIGFRCARADKPNSSK